MVKCNLSISTNNNNNSIDSLTDYYNIVDYNTDSYNSDDNTLDIDTDHNNNVTKNAIFSSWSMSYTLFHSSSHHLLIIFIFISFIDHCVSK